MKIVLDPNSLVDYRTFLAIKRLPIYYIRGREAWIPDEYAEHIGMSIPRTGDAPIELAEHLFDYQRAGATIAIRKRKFSLFWRPGLGKTNPMFEHVRHARKVLPPQKRCLIVAPLMVIDQHLEEAARFYPQMAIEVVKARELKAWLRGEGGIGITNYEAMTDDLEAANLGCLDLDESSLLKSQYGKWGQVIIRLGRGIDWKLCLTGTPAPNDRIEFANHAVHLDHYPNVNSFLSRYFVNRGETKDRWELRPHATRPFYVGLSHWAMFLNDPTTYGFSDNSGMIPPIHIHIHEVDATDEQMEAYRKLTGKMVVTSAGGVGSRTKMSQIAKGRHNGQDIPTGKFDYIKALRDSWPEESTLIWCRYNPEQERMAKMFPDAASIDGRTPHAKRMEMIRDFKSGAIKTLISKPKIMQFGLNLQICTRHIWSTLLDSYEEFKQGCCRSNRIGSTLPLNVHLPVLELERPMIETVLEKSKRIEEDDQQQESLFKEIADEYLRDFR
jgi:SNF2-related domain